ncbi:MAG: hypothetical protein NZV14_16920 [Bryobacteraceae bacterium]|nr:hypothetical protein [Bryobacteraceae bacterium]MDW8379845.1 hypothetical protein [Bryobacterales bacterium]
MKRTGLWIAAGALAFLALLFYFTLGMRRSRVEVCMEFHGRRACRTASAETPEKARRAAIDNACALIASGVTDSIACQNTPPLSVRRLE